MIKGGKISSVETTSSSLAPHQSLGFLSVIFSEGLSYYWPLSLSSQWRLARSRQSLASKSAKLQWQRGRRNNQRSARSHLEEEAEDDVQGEVRGQEQEDEEQEEVEADGEGNGKNIQMNR